MFIVNIDKGRTMKSVIVGFDAGEQTSVDAIREFAMTAARETSDSTFGSMVNFHDDETATVNIYTD